MTNDCLVPCPPSCPTAFSRVRVTPLIAGGTRVEWQLVPNFFDPEPHSFQLQVGRTSNPAADDWTNVGLPALDSFYALDDSQRVFGKSQWTHYRVVLTTPNGTYFSDPVPALGALSAKDWNATRYLLKQHRLRLQKTMPGVEGYLLKRRLYGAPCTVCLLDNQTGNIRQPQCPVCYGTGFNLGYFAPLSCVYADLSLRMTRDELDGQMRGTVNDVHTTGLFLGSPYLEDRDVWVDRHADVRYEIRGIQWAAAWRGVPLLLQAGLYPLPFKHVLYQFPIPGQVPS